MTGLNDISVTLETSPRRGTVSPAIKALLAELTTHISRLATDGVETSIDVKALLSDGERHRLFEMLGQGEVSARLDAFGPSLIYETAVPGIWRVLHRSAADDLLADLLLVTRFPEILMTPAESLTESTELLVEFLKGREGL